VEDLPDFVKPSPIRTIEPGAAPVLYESPDSPPITPTLAEIEKAWILYVIEHRAGGQKKLAARLLGIDESTLHRKLERYSPKGQE
jgi:two-component system response regulator HydG